MNNIDLRHTPCVLLDDSRPSQEAGLSYLFTRPERIICANSFDEIEAALNAIDKAVAEGFYVAGWVSYEVAAHFEVKISNLIKTKADEALIWMMVTKHRASLTGLEVEKLLHDAKHGNTRGYTVKCDLQTADQQAYQKSLQKIQNYINAGDVYQINYTFPMPVSLTGDVLAFYRQLRINQPVPYSAYINTGETEVLSLSPELFLAKQADTLISKPMKGTAPRGKNLDEDIAATQHLKTDKKSQAENLMIVDLIRNDLSRIAQTGTVDVPHLFETEKYQTLFQMTSTVTAKATSSLTPSATLKAMFPCGSVTGAPKIRAMEIIHELEKEPRGIYCGSIGYFGPTAKNLKTNWSLNVPIRTFIFNTKPKTEIIKGRLHIGSGIVADSDANAEFKECLLKAQFAQKNTSAFSLIETIRFENNKYKHLEQHLLRLANSSKYFGFNFDADAVTHQITEHAHALPQMHRKHPVYKVRLLLDQSGACSISSEPFTDSHQKTPHNVSISTKTTDSNNAFYQHKTTNRGLYNSELRKAQENGHTDVLFCNEHGHITESAISNIFIKLDQQLITPPVTDGLLPGVGRTHMLATNNVVIQSLTIDDLKKADEILLVSALRGSRTIKLANFI